MRKLLNCCLSQFQENTMRGPILNMSPGLGPSGVDMEYRRNTQGTSDGPYIHSVGYAVATSSARICKRYWVPMINSRLLFLTDWLPRKNYAICDYDYLRYEVSPVVYVSWNSIRWFLPSCGNVLATEAFNVLINRNYKKCTAYNLFKRICQRIDMFIITLNSECQKLFQWTLRFFCHSRHTLKNYHVVR